MDKAQLIAVVRDSRAPIQAATAGPGAAPYDESVGDNPHPWLEGTAADTVIEGTSSHCPERLPHAA